MYLKNNNQHVVLFDVDNTLVTFDFISGEEPIEIEIGTFLYPITKNIEKLKQHKIRNHFVRVHSQGGVEWAERIIKLLRLERYVDSVEAKPLWYCDDLDANEWMTRFYER